jgi:DNA repair exonuclease SbcCD ATPase subunit
VQRQIDSVSATLGLDRSRVFAVSAQKGLVAKVTGDAALLGQSRLPALESALVDLLVPARQRIVREQTMAVVDRMMNDVRQALSTRERGLIEQLYELRALQGKNQSSVERMLARARAEQRDFEENVRKVVAARTVLARLAEQCYEPLRVEALRGRVLEARERMRKVRLTPQFGSAVRDYFSQVRGLLRSSNGRLQEVEKMVAGVQRRFAEDLGWSLQPPMPFSLDTYVAELERAEATYRSHFGTLAALTRDKWALIERFFDTVVSKSREIFSAAERDAEAWVRSLLPPLELQVREQRGQLKKRAEAVARILDAQESLDERIGQLEDALQEVQAKLDALRGLAARAQDAAREELEPAPPEHRAANGIGDSGGAEVGLKDVTARNRQVAPAHGANGGGDGVGLRPVDAGPRWQPAGS